MTPASQNRIFLSPPHLGSLETQFLEEAVKSNWITTLGPQVTALERELADYAGMPDAVVLSSGTAALHLGLKVLNVKRGDVVLCSTLTFVASANPILYEGAEAAFVDSNLESWNLSPTALERAVHQVVREGKHPKALVVTDLYGQSADFDSILEICRKHKIAVLEDAAEALGATYKEKKCGSLGDLGVYSFNGNKIITTSGGGAVVSRNKEWIEKIRFWSTQARDPYPHYEHSEVGFNYRMSNLLAAVGRGQLRVLENRVERRREIFSRYQEALKDIEEIHFMPEPTSGRSTRWLTTLSLTPQKNTKPDDIIRALAEENIESRHVWKPMHRQPLFKNSSYFSHAENQSCSDHLFEWGVVLPSGTQMSDADQDRVIGIVRKCFGRT